MSWRQLQGRRRVESSKYVEEVYDKGTTLFYYLKSKYMEEGFQDDESGC